MLRLLPAFILLVARQCRADEPKWLPVHGKVVLPEGLQGVSLSQAEVVLQLDSGKRMLAFPVPDGSFAFPQVPVGVHTLYVQLPGLLFPTLKLDVGTAKIGKIGATAVDMPGSPALAYPVILRPFSRIEYFEKRQGFNLLNFLKTPYGMMAAFMVFSMFIMPRLKVDPEEYKEMMGQGNQDRERSVTPASGGGQQGGRRRAD